MSDTLITVIAIALAAVLMFVFPLMTMSDRTDDVSQLAVETTTTDFVDEVRTTGKITPDKYNKFIENIGSTGNTYNVEMQVQVLDENPGKKTLTLQSDKIGENAYYSVYTSQIEEVLNNNKNYNLKEGDMFSVSVKNTNQTLAQQLKNFFYTVVGNDTYTIAASHGGMVTATGK
ncbi:MAG: hypothetical protein BHW00_05510 [Clostridium sp. 26_22]|jgi:hypothetical protein|nr:MAG: hypothetical protein BHW00_05510 [Clostridium sp. 26_22]